MTKIKIKDCMFKIRVDLLVKSSRALVSLSFCYLGSHCGVVDKPLALFPRVPSPFPVSSILSDETLISHHQAPRL